MSDRASSVFARTSGGMFTGEKEGDEFQARRDPTRRILTGEGSSILARGGSGEDIEGRGSDSEGFLEEVGFERTEKNALVERIEELEKELYDYQYHMGLLLIEKKMRTTEFEELREALSEARENLNLERASFFRMNSEKQTQEQILIALEAEKQHVANEAESTQEKLEKKEIDLLATQLKLPTRETALQIEKQVFDQELESERGSLDGELKDKLNKFWMQNIVEENYGSQTIDDLLAHKIFLEKNHIKGQNHDSSLQSKGSESVKIEGCIPCLQQCPDLCCFNSRGSDPHLPTDGNARETTDTEIRSQPMIFHDNLDSKSVEFGNGARKIEIIERFPKNVLSLEQYEIANDALKIECQLNTSSFNEQNESHALSSKTKSGRQPIKRAGSMKAVVKNFEETLEDIPNEVKHLQNCGSEDLKDANEKIKFNLLNADKMAGSAEQPELLYHAPGTTFEIDSYDRKIQLVNEGHLKRQKTFGIEFGFPGQKRYNFRPSTILKVLMSKLQSEQVVFGTDNNEMDVDYEPNNSD